MKFLEWPRLSVWLTGLAALGLGAACGDTVRLRQASRGDSGFDSGAPYPPYPPDATITYDGEVLADSGSAGDAGQPSDGGLRGYGRVRVSGDPDAAGFDASVSALFTRQNSEPVCLVEFLDSCRVYRCEPVPDHLPEPVVPASVRVRGALGECTLGVDSVTGVGACGSSFWNFDAPVETLGVMSAGGAFPVFRADFVVPTRAQLSEPPQQAQLPRTSTHFAWSGGTAGEVELTLRSCTPSSTSPEAYAVCVVPVYGNVLDVPEEVLTRLSDVSCLSGTLSSFVAMTQNLGGYQVEVRVELDFPERFDFLPP
jgi:hypothetical protein